MCTSPAKAANCSIGASGCRKGSQVLENCTAISTSDTKARKIFADAAVVPMVDAVAKCMARTFKPAETMSEIQKPREGAFGSKGNWTREQTILAFHFYCQTPFGQLHAKNKKIIELAELIGRTPGALAMKCVNIASIDPAIRESGRAGLRNASSQDRKIWQEFHKNWDALIEQAEALQTHLLRERGMPPPQTDSEIIATDFTGETRVALVKQRVKQAFFRRSVLSSYSGKCCISGVSDGRFLVASHIVAWKDDASIRLNPANGLCLSTIHDRAFDSHLFSLTDDHRVILSKSLHDTKDQFLREVFLKLNGTQIALPERFTPNPEYITRHRNHMQKLQDG